MSLANRLEDAVRAAGVSGITGVSIGDPGDRATWRVRFDGTETPGDIATAQGVLDTVDLESPAALDIELQKRINGDPVLVAVTLASLDFLNGVHAALVPPLPPVTASQFRTAVLAHLKTILSQ